MMQRIRARKLTKDTLAMYSIEDSDDGWSEAAAILKGTEKTGIDGGAEGAGTEGMAKGKTFACGVANGEGEAGGIPK